MGTFAETVNVDVYIYTDIYRYIYIYFIYIYECMYINIYAAVSSRKRKPEAQVIFYNPFYRFLIVQAKVCRLSIFYKETNGSYPLVNGLNRLAHLCIQVIIYGTNFLLKNAGVSGSVPIGLKFLDSRQFITSGFPKATRTDKNGFLKAAENLMTVNCQLSTNGFQKPFHMAVTSDLQKPFEKAISTFRIIRIIRIISTVSHKSCF